MKLDTNIDSLHPDPKPTLKRCSKCGKHKPLEQFSKIRKTKDGLQSRCKACANAYNKAWMTAHPEKNRANTAAWQAAHPEKSRANHNHRKYLRRAKALNCEVPFPGSTHDAVVRDIYLEAQRLTAKTGICHEVNHVLPLKLGGAHMPWNLQIVPRHKHRAKNAATGGSSRLEASK